MVNEIVTEDIKAPAFSGATSFESFEGSDGCMIYKYYGTEKKHFNEYNRSLEQNGFSFFDSHILRDNYFSSYRKDGTHVKTYFTENDNITTIIIDPESVPYVTEKQHKNEQIESINRTELYQLELDFTSIDCGMCYIIKCIDGSFFIIDSAHQNSTNDHIRIHDFLRKLTAQGEKIRIAGWFFSHAHQDHIVKFMDFIRYGFNDYEIENLYYNFPSMNACGHERWKSGDVDTMNEFSDLMKKRKELPKVKLHTGDRFFVRNLEFEVLGTHEDIYPDDVGRFNDTSTVLMMTVDGYKVFFPGDANIKMSDILLSRYGSKLRAPMVQMSHHGFNGCTVGIYSAVRADVVLFSTSKLYYEKNVDRDANKRAVVLCKENYISSAGTAKFVLPYKLATAQVLKKEIPDPVEPYNG